LKDIHPTHTNKSSHGSSERLLKITFRIWCWLGFSWLTGDGGLCNHVSHNIWIHVWSNPSKSRGRERERKRGLRLGLLERERESERGLRLGLLERKRERERERRLGLLERKRERERERERKSERRLGLLEGGDNFFYL